MYNQPSRVRYAYGGVRVSSKEHGLYPEDGPLYKGQHTPIITKELYENVRARIDDIVPENKAAWGSKKFLFKHLFYCGSSSTAYILNNNWQSPTSWRCT